MISPRNIFLLAAAGVALIAVAVGGTLAVTSMTTQQQHVPSDGAIYMFGNKLVSAENSASRQWNDFTVASTSVSDPLAPLTCSADSTRIASFLSKFGDERNPSAWTMWEFLGKTDGGQIATVAPLTLGRMSSGQGAAARASGGSFSLGVACTKNNNTEVTAAYYRTVTVKAGGEWTVDPVK
jgi:hypothetical protein